jgi:flagellin
MALYINTNIASLYAQNNVANSQSALATSIQRLSSGLRINSAKDDAAGMAIAARMTSQIGGLNQAAQNANDGISMAQTADGALAQVTNDLQTMRNLAVQAANGTNSSSDRASLQASISQLQADISNISSNTQYNGLNLLDGTLTNVQFQVGANANQTIDASIGSASANSMGNYQVNVVGTMTNAAAASSTATTNGVAAQTLTVSGNGATATASIASNASAYAIAQAVNTATAGGNTNVTATALTTATLGSFVTGGSVSFSLAGTNGTAVNIAATMTSATDVTGLAAAINAQSSTTGITAVANTNNGTLALTQAQGYDISITGYTNSNGAASTAALNGFSSTGTATTPQTLTSGSTNSSSVGGQVTFNGSNGYTVATTAAGTIAAASSAGALVAVSSIDVTTMKSGIPTGANSALSVVDSAINYINGLRAQLGALQNRFTNAQSALTTTSTNMQQARSRIQDTDFAAETANLTHNQILQQAGTAMLAQANAMPNSVLTLLK